MKATHKKGKGTTYIYRGTLTEEIQKAKRELNQKTNDPERHYVKWAYEKAKKKYESNEQRISDLEKFIKLAEKEIEKRNTEQNEEDSKDR